jgi:hypothetical protein
VIKSAKNTIFPIHLKKDYCSQAVEMRVNKSAKHTALNSTKTGLLKIKQ